MQMTENIKYGVLSKSAAFDRKEGLHLPGLAVSKICSFISPMAIDQQVWRMRSKAVTPNSTAHEPVTQMQPAVAIIYVFSSPQPLKPQRLCCP